MLFFTTLAEPIYFKYCTFISIPLNNSKNKRYSDIWVECVEICAFCFLFFFFLNLDAAALFKRLKYVCFWEFWQILRTTLVAASDNTNIQQLNLKFKKKNDQGCLMITTSGNLVVISKRNLLKKLPNKLTVPITITNFDVTQMIVWWHACWFQCIQ